MSKNDCSQCPFYHEHYNCYDGGAEISCDCGQEKKPCSYSILMRRILALKTLIKEATQELSLEVHQIMKGEDILS